MDLGRRFGFRGCCDVTRSVLAYHLHLIPPLPGNVYSGMSYTACRQLYSAVERYLRSIFFSQTIFSYLRIIATVAHRNGAVATIAVDAIQEPDSFMSDR